MPSALCPESSTIFRDDTNRTDFGARLGVAVPALFGGTQTRPAVTARQFLAYVWVEGSGRRARLAVEGDEVGAVAGDPNDQSAIAVQIPERRLIGPLAADKTW